jgi:uncharacterized protein DUF664
MAARADMFLDPADDPRESRPPMPDERSTLTTYLRDQRLTLEIKCAGLDAEGMAARSVPPSTLSLLGIVRHLADVERSWMRRFMAGRDAPPLYYSAEDRDGGFDNAVADPALVEEAWAAWRAECGFTDAYVGDAPASTSSASTRLPCTPRCGTCSCTSSRSTPATTGTPTCFAS